MIIDQVTAQSLLYITNIREGSSVPTFSDGGTYSASELTCITVCVATNRVD